MLDFVLHSNFAKIKDAEMSVKCYLQTRLNQVRASFWKQTFAPGTSITKGQFHKALYNKTPKNESVLEVYLQTTNLALKAPKWVAEQPK